MSADKEVSHAATLNPQLDPLSIITDWRQRCMRYGRARHGTTIDVLQNAITEIEQLRERFERCEQKHRELRQIALGPRGRGLPR